MTGGQVRPATNIWTSDCVEKSMNYERKNGLASKGECYGVFFFWAFQDQKKKITSTFYSYFKLNYITSPYGLKTVTLIIIIIIKTSSSFKRHFDKEQSINFIFRVL